MTAVLQRLAALRGRRAVFLHLLGAALPLLAALLASALGMPPFVFEHVIVLLVVGVALAGGMAPAITVALVATAGDDILLREPFGRPAITGARDLVDLGLFLAVALTVGWLVTSLGTARARAVAAAERERQAREDRDRVVAAVTHDLATPLNAIQGTVQFVRKHRHATEMDYERLMTRIETAAARATSLIRTLSDMQTLQRDDLVLEFRTLDLREVVEPLVHMLDKVSDRHPIAFVMHPEPLVVRCDPERIGRVVENLIANAIKYSPDGGPVEVSLQPDGNSVALTVRDYGVGVPPEAFERIFGRGYRVPASDAIAPGLGLGLYIASEIVRRHDGTLEVSSPDGGGSTFTVRLPRAEVPALLERGP